MLRSIVRRVAKLESHQPQGDAHHSAIQAAVLAASSDEDLQLFKEAWELHDAGQPLERRHEEAGERYQGRYTSFTAQSP